MRKKEHTKDFINKDYIDLEGNAVVDVIIDDRSKLFSPYSDKKLLNREIFMYLDTIADPIPNIYPLIINFVIPDLDKIDKSYVRDALKRYYWFSYKEKVMALRNEMVVSLLFLFIGFLLLIFGSVFIIEQTSSFMKVFSNFVVLLSWVFLWEAIRHLLVGRREKVVDKNNERQMAYAEVRFISKSDEVERATWL
jgi:hypothetical protein